MDVRPFVIPDRLREVRRIVAVGGGKGGTGKSSISSLLALALADRGANVGLLDLDLTGASDHLILGFPTAFPKEEFGIEPALHAGVRCLSVAQFLGNRPVALRGEETTQALLELLAIARWGRLDVLVLDLPPGLQDTTLDLLRYLKRAEFLMVTTPSRVVLGTVERSLSFLASQKMTVAGLVENMSDGSGDMTLKLAERFAVPFLGQMPHERALEASLGDTVLLRRTKLFGVLREHLASQFFSDP